MLLLDPRSVEKVAGLFVSIDAIVLPRILNIPAGYLEFPTRVLPLPASVFTGPIPFRTFRWYCSVSSPFLS